MEDNTRVKLGSIYLHFWNTPGHTLESVTILVTLSAPECLETSHISEHKPQAIFSGDTIFIGDVGRPDLAATEDGNITSTNLAEMMFDSVQRIKELPNEVLIFPGHGAGSACGKNISNAFFATIDNQKKTNYAFLEENKEEFVKKLTKDLPPPPDYFKFNVELNKNKYIQNTDSLIKNSNNPITPSKFNELIKTNKYTLLDCRNKSEFEESHIPNSLFAPFNSKFAIFAADIISRPKKSILLIVPEGQNEQCIKRLSRTGIDVVEGYLTSFEDYKSEGFETTKVDQIFSQDLFEDYSSESPQIQIVDVREISEWKNGHVNNAILISLPVIKDKIYNHISDKNKNFAVHCRSGLRSLVAWAFLKSEGFKNVKNIVGGYQKMIENDFTLEDN